MHRLGALSTPVRSFIREFGGARSGRSSLPFRSRSERLLIVGCVSFAGVAGWNQRRLNHNTGQIEYLPLGGDNEYRTGLGAKELTGGHGAEASGTTPERIQAVSEILENGRDSNRELESSTDKHTHWHSARPDARNTPERSDIDDHRGGALPGHDGEWRGERGDRTARGSKARAATGRSEGEVAEDEGASAVPAPSLIRRTHVSQEKSEHLARDELGRLKSRQKEDMQNSRQASSIEEAVASASWRKLDRSHQPRMRQAVHDYPRKYFTQGKEHEKSKVLKQVRRVQIQTERHKYLDELDHAQWFRDIIEQLGKATPTGAQHYARKKEIARLPPGVKVWFNGNSGEAVLEIMQRTGCHIQIIPMRTDSGMDLAGLVANEGVAMSTHGGFSELSMFGTPAENAAALALLPDLVKTIRKDEENASKNMREYDIRTEGAHRVTTLEDDTKDGEEQPEGIKDDSSQSDAPRLRGYWLRQSPDINRVIRARTSNHADSKTTFIRPEKLSCITLTSYLTDLTAVPAPLIGRSNAGLHEPGAVQTDSLKQQTISEILAIFSEPATSYSISTEAVDIALALCVRYSDFAALRSLLNILEKVPEYSLTAKNYDIALAAAASNDDVHNFRLVLRTMLQQKIQPSGRTWLSLYRLVCRRFPNTKSPKLVLRFMGAKGILNNVEHMQEAVKTTLGRSLTFFLNGEGADATIEEFVARLDGKYAVLPDPGPRSTQHITAKAPRPWLSKTAANIMAKSLLDRGRTGDALRVMQLLEGAGHHVGIDTINIFLGAAKRSRDPSFAVAILRNFEHALTRQDKLRVRLDEMSYSMLFSIAWRKKCLNMLRGIWRYACCTGQVDHAMAARVHDSLLAYLPPNRSRETKVYNEKKLREAVKNVRGGDQKRQSAQEQIGRHLEHQGLRSGEMFFALAGKFVVGVSNHAWQVKEPSLEIHDDNVDVFGRAVDPSAEKSGALPMGESVPDEHHNHSSPPSLHAATQAWKSVDPGTIIDWILHPQEEEILALACQPRTIALPSIDLSAEAIPDREREAHRRRYRELSSFRNEDMRAPTSYRPYVPFATLLDQAWQKDMRWHDRGLGMGGRGEEGKAARKRLLGSDVSEEEKAESWKGLLRDVMEHGIFVPVVVGDAVR
ncbi:hypothetical protein LTR78_001280 [Recurvomyces mirabilis]|uniref:Uncharacterized protein n=1 Tax=Recurvomyces mirabilis TaxID=574656 RepID=A0AAE1C5I8_9PEZI|nr:hypothetical protein LTR78_001280 [Recurvomyces mirabilis]KAK5161257.1 hypothetical protein LTS14_001053 [Recurvomyces mirabilis]